MERRLLVAGQPVALGARAFDLLVELAARPGQLRSKNELIDAVWPGVVVEEGNLATQISTLRKVLGGDVIATIPGRGYRFTARLEAPAPADTAAAASSRAASGQAEPGDAVPAPWPSAPPPAPSPLPTTAPAAAPPVLRTNLPQPLPALLGRADDLAALGALVDAHPLVSVVGAGGMGKSLLAQHLLASRRGTYPHGVCWVELAPLTDPAALPGAIARALGVPVGGSDALAGLCGALAPLAMLVALDNAEHLLEPLAVLVQALMGAASQVRIVVTSQVPLQLPAERVYRIGALAVPQGALPAEPARAFGAVALFVDRAQAADARFELTDANAPAVIDLCRQLDGLALAIELAAARAPMLGVHKLAASMGDRLKLLTGGRNRTAPAPPADPARRAGLEPRPAGRA